MRIDKDQIIGELNLTLFGGQGYLQDKNTECPYCQKKDKWGIKFSEDGNSGFFHCFKCQTKTSIFNYLIEIGRKDLCKVTYEASIKKNKLNLLIPEKEETEDKELKDVKLPKQLKRITNDEYLDSRSFLPIHYDEYEPSFTVNFLEKKLHDYIIFKIKQDRKCVAWLARSRKSKEWHKENLKKSKEGICERKLRYENSEGTVFTKFLGGYDRIIEGVTETVILVEGIFDSVNIDKLMNLDKVNDIRCCFTFGDSISKEQINLLKKKKVENVILMYDPDAYLIKKAVGLQLNKHFNTLIAVLNRPDVDPGSMDIKYLNEVLNTLKSPINYYTDII